MAALRRGEFSRARAAKGEIRKPSPGSFIKAIHVVINVKIGGPLGSHPTLKILRLVLF